MSNFDTYFLNILGFTLFATSEDSGDRLASVVIRDGQDTYYLHPTVRSPVPRCALKFLYDFAILLYFTVSVKIFLVVAFLCDLIIPSTLSLDLV